MFANKKQTERSEKMANLIIVCGPQAVGKMTVAESLRDKLKYNMTMNHDSIEISDRIFGFNTPAQREFGGIFRQQVFDLAVKHDVDLIFTYVCAFDMPSEREYLDSLAAQFEATGGQFYLIELRADLETRLERNVTPHRMERKPSKRDVEWSRNNLLRDAEKYRLNSNEDEIWYKNHLKIDNTNLSPDEVADIVIRTFSLTPNDKPESEYRFGV
jgi:cytidylate kinase